MASRYRQRHRQSPLRSAILDVRTAAWLARCFARALAGDVRRTLRSHRLGWR